VEQADKTRVMVTKFWTLFILSVKVSENGCASVFRCNEERHSTDPPGWFFHFCYLPEDGSTYFL
jgi:hypothetical protein